MSRPFQRFHTLMALCAAAMAATPGLGIANAIAMHGGYVSRGKGQGKSNGVARGAGMAAKRAAVKARNRAQHRARCR